MASITFQSSLGNDRFVEVNQWKGKLRVDIREWKHDKPTKKGFSLTLMRWKNFVQQLEYTDRALHGKISYWSHLGGNVYCSTSAGVRVDIRKYWKPLAEVVPTKKGIYLRPSEYVRLKQL